MWKLGKRSQRVYNSGINPELRRIIDMACVVCPIEFTLTDGVRSKDNQFRLYRRGRNRDDAGRWIITDKSKVVTYADGVVSKSNHQRKDNGYGSAIDVCVYIKGRPDLAYDKIHLSAIIGSFLTVANVLYHEGKNEHRLKSGSDWDNDTQWLEPGTFADLPHLQLM